MTKNSMARPWKRVTLTETFLIYLTCNRHRLVNITYINQNLKIIILFLYYSYNLLLKKFKDFYKILSHKKEMYSKHLLLENFAFLKQNFLWNSHICDDSKIFMLRNLCNKVFKLERFSKKNFHKCWCWNNIQYRIVNRQWNTFFVFIHINWPTMIKKGQIYF